MSTHQRLLQMACVFAGCAAVATACGSGSEKNRGRESYDPNDGGQAGAGGDPSTGGSNQTAGTSQGGSNVGARSGSGGDAGSAAAAGQDQGGASGQGDGGGGTTVQGLGGADGGAGNGVDGGQAGEPDGRAGEAGSGGAGGSASCSEVASSVGPILLNGSFELPALAAPGWIVIAAGQEPASFGWSVLADVDVSRVGWTSGQGLVDAPAEDGIQLLDVVAFGSEGGLRQTIDVVPGESYVLALSYANNPVTDPPLPSASATVTARVCDQIIFSETLTHTTSTKSDFDWTDYSHTFTATDSIVTIEVIETVGGGAGGILLDAISLEPE